MANSLFSANTSLFFLKQGDFGLDDTAVGLNLRFTGTAHTDTASLTLEVGPHTRQSRQQVLVLRQFDLHLGAGGLCALGKDVEDEARAVERLDLDGLLDEGNLLGREVVVKDDKADVVVLDKIDNFFEFALADVGRAVGAVAPLQESAHGDGARRLGEEFKFVEVFFGLGFALLGGNQSHEDGAFLLSIYFVDAFAIVNESHKVTFFII